MNAEQARLQAYLEDAARQREELGGVVDLVTMTRLDSVGFDLDALDRELDLIPLD